MTITIEGLTKDRMLAIEAESVVGGAVNGAGHLILTRHDGAPIDAGYVVGPQGPPYVNGVDTVSNQAIGGLKNFTQPILEIAGAAANPSYSFLADQNTGMLNSAADVLDLVTGGATRLRVRNSQVDVLASAVNIMPTGISGGRALYINEFAGETGNFVDLELNGVRKLDVDNTGAIRSMSAASWFGGGARGADQSAMYIGQYDPDFALISARNDIRANVGLIIQSKGTGSILLRTGANTAKNIAFDGNGMVTFNHGGVGQSIMVTEGVVDIATGSVRIGRVVPATAAHSLVFTNSLGYDYIIGRVANNDDLVFGVNFGTGLVERFRMDTSGNLKTPVGGTMQASEFRTVIPGGEFGQARVISPSNYGRVELQGNSNGIILSNNAGVTKHLIGARFDVMGNSDDCVFYSYGGKYQWWIGGVTVAEVGYDGSGGHLFVHHNPGSGTDSGLALNFSFVGLKRISCGAVDSGGAGFRMVRCAN